MFRKIRIGLALLFSVAITLLFLDITGTLHTYLGWLAKIQFWPAVLALNVGVLILLIGLTLIMGRVYCSVICPLGILQDFFSWIGGKVKKNRFSFSSEKRIVRYVILTLFVILTIIGFNTIALYIEPYSAYGRIVNGLLQPLYVGINNLLATTAERMNSYAFYEVETLTKALPLLIVAIVTLVVVAYLSFKNGRTWCNTICPVGTLLGFLSKFSWFKPVINTEKCISCGLCEKNCKASCINAKTKEIDDSRCVTCMNCIDKCKKGAIQYIHPKNRVQTETVIDESRRKFLATSAVLATTMTVKAQAKKVDGGLTVIQDKQIPTRNVSPKPAGALSLKNFETHCTACQLCVSACNNNVLRPSTKLENLLQPEMSFEEGYCRPECVKCSEVCPTGAIHLITPAEKSSIKIGKAVYIKDNCVVKTDRVECGNCARHCPVGAINMFASDEFEGRKIPVVNAERCIGCGACENLCPARPFSAIYVEGYERQMEI